MRLHPENALTWPNDFRVRFNPLFSQRISPRARTRLGARFAAPEEIGALVACLASGRAANITGVSYLTDRGLITTTWGRDMPAFDFAAHRIPGASR
jgi:NAD(P)-dependent dehydrogenase (short-subunit alcohol dehydrogenase family)